MYLLSKKGIYLASVLMVLFVAWQWAKLRKTGPLGV